jgi:hypothetical protein
MHRDRVLLLKIRFVARIWYVFKQSQQGVLVIFLDPIIQDLYVGCWIFYGLGPFIE